MFENITNKDLFRISCRLSDRLGELWLRKVNKYKSYRSMQLYFRHNKGKKADKEIIRALVEILKSNMISYNEGLIM